MEETAPGKAEPEQQVQPEGDVPQPKREQGKKTASSHARCGGLCGSAQRPGSAPLAFCFFVFESGLLRLVYMQ